MQNFSEKVSFIWSVADLLRDSCGPKHEVLPHVPDAWVDESKTKVGYEINFNRYFYKYTPPRPLGEIEADLRTIEKQIAELLGEVAG